MKFVWITDPHAHEQRIRPNTRASDLGFEIAKEAVVLGQKEEAEFIFSTGDDIQFDRENLARNFEHWQMITDIFRSVSQMPFHGVLGNHEYDILRTNPDACDRLHLNSQSHYFDHVDGTRVIMLQQSFKDNMNDPKIYDWSVDNVRFLKHAMDSQSAKRFIVMSHSPLDDFEGDECRDILVQANERNFYGDLFFRNAWRENSNQMRQIMVRCGRPVLALAGHTHVENFQCHKNVAYLTLQSATSILQNNEQVYGRYAAVDWADDNTIYLSTKGYKATDYKFHYRDSGVFRKQRVMRPKEPRFILAA